MTKTTPKKPAAKKAATKKATAAAPYGHGDLSWFTHDRFGMFIHWGLYSMPARHEWIRNYERITDEDYQIYFDLFNPDLFDPKAWARTAREAGMKYFVVTTKHHEGFCLWDTKYTDYKITNTPFGRDALREIVDAFRAEGIRVGFYYSLIDWHHPDFTVDDIHPLAFHDREKLNQGRDMKRYAKYMRDQVTELLTSFGKIDIMWFDFSYPWREKKPEELKWSRNNPARRSWDGKGRDEWEADKLVRLVRKLQPEIVIDNRVDIPEAGDIITPEQYTPDAPLTHADGTPAAWEGCQTFSGSWGYYRDELCWKTTKQCIDMLINHVSRGGNLIMNVGPTSRGYFDDRAMERLQGYARWMKYNSRSIYGCGPAPKGFVEPVDSRYTYNPETNRLYLHLQNWPFKHIQLPGLAGKVRYTQFLHDGSELHFREAGDGQAVHAALNATSPKDAVTIELPVQQPDVEVPVIEIFLK